MRCKLLCCVLCLSLIALPAAAVTAGAAACDITPDIDAHDVPMAGYGAREGKPATSVHDSIQAKVLVLEDGATKTALVAADLRSVTTGLKQAILERVTDLGFSEANLLLCASHSHSGPSIFPEPFWQLQFGKYDPAIIPPMADAIAGAIREASENAVEIRAGVASKPVPDFTRNRRWHYDQEAREAAGETPCVDPKLTVVRFDNMDGEPIALLTHFATHPTIIGAESFAISAEWPGVLQDELEAKFPGAVAVYVNGAEGDQSPAGAEGATDFDRIADYGARLAAEAAELAASIDTTAPRFLTQAHREPALPPIAFSEGAKQGPYSHMEPLALEALPRTAELQVFGIGSVALVGLPGEPLCEVGLATEASVREAGFDHPLVIGLANDYIGYIVNEKEYGHGGYEVDLRSYYGPSLGAFIAEEAGKTAMAARPRMTGGPARVE